MSKELQKSNVKTFVLAGNATITLQSGKTGKHFTYKIVRHKNTEVYFVNLLHGQNNDEDYQYIGCYYADSKYFNPCKKWKDVFSFIWPPSVRAIKYLFDNIDNVPDKLHVYHEGRCAKCGRKLTTPESIERGFGPECFKEAFDV